MNAVGVDIKTRSHYLLRYVQGVDPWGWLASMHLRHKHSLTPKAISVQGFLVDETDGR